jgi:hypothetical protein
MNTDPLLAPFAKIEWAKTEIDKLAERINDLFFVPDLIRSRVEHEFPGDHPAPPDFGLFPLGKYKVSSQIDANGIEVWQYVVPPIPSSFNVTVGAILHSLRSPLDQMLSAIAIEIERHASPKGVSFPFGETREKFEAELAKQKKVPADALDMIAQLEPYKVGGNSLLYGLHALNTPDKHHPGLVPINLQTSTSLNGLMVYGEGQILTIGPRSGRHLALDANQNLSQADKSKRPGYLETEDGFRCILGLNPGLTFEMLLAVFYNQTPKRAIDFGALIEKARLPADAPQDDLEIVTTIPGTKFEAELHPTFNIALSNVDTFEREPVVAVLHQMRQLVESILLTFEKRFFR